MLKRYAFPNAAGSNVQTGLLPVRQAQAAHSPPDVVKLLQHAGVEPIGCTPEQSAIALGNENQRFTVPAKAAGLRAD